MIATASAPFHVSRHALDRIVEMCLDGEEVRAVMLNPRTRRSAGIGKEYWERGRVTCLVAIDGHAPVVVSVLWARMSDWVEDESTINSRGTVASADQHRRTRHQIKSRKAHTHRSKRR